MTISAELAVPANDLLARAVELYRDLSVALRDRITTIKTGIDDDAKGQQELLRAHQKSLQSVLEIEASLDRRSRTLAGGASAELNLEAARAEIAERLARWSLGN